MHAWPRLPAVVLAASAPLAMAASAPPAAQDRPDQDGPRLPAADYPALRAEFFGN